MYYRDADAVLMVFDVTNISTLHAVENYWSNVLRQNLSKPDVPILLVGNKVKQNNTSLCTLCTKHSLAI